MKNLFVPYELAVIAKEKGFNETCLAIFEDKNTLWYGGLEYDADGHFKNENSSNICAPLYQQLVDWFREKHNLFIKISIEETNNSFEEKVYDHCILNMFWGEEKEIHRECNGYNYKSYYEALNKAIEEAFKLI